MKLIKILLYFGTSCVTLIMILLIANDLSNSHLILESKEASIQTNKQKITYSPKNYRKIIDSQQVNQTKKQVTAAPTKKSRNASSEKTSLLKINETANLTIVNLNNRGFSMRNPIVHNTTDPYVNNHQINFTQFKAETHIPFDFQKEINPKSIFLAGAVGDLWGNNGPYDGLTAPLSDTLPLLIIFIGIYTAVISKKQRS